MSNIDEQHTNPISLKPLWHCAWIFFLYGMITGAWLGLSNRYQLDLDRAQSLMMEPLSFYAFLGIALFGFVGLGVLSFTNGMDGKKMNESRAAQMFLIPIANTGLSTGAIILGMTLGLGLSIGAWGSFATDSDLGNISKLFLGTSAYVLFLLYPLAWFLRSLFDASEAQQKLTTRLGAGYSIVVAAIVFFISPAAFWWLLALSLMLCLVGFYVGHYWANRKRSGAGS